MEDQNISYWLVGSSRGHREDMTNYLLENGIWEFWPSQKKPDRYVDTIKSMRPGDRIAIKAAYVRKKDLPFDNHNQPVSVMGIKAIGTITANRGDGRVVDVDWHPRIEPPKEWFFYTFQKSIWKPDINHPKRGEMAKQLIDFVFHDEPQDFDYFLENSFWNDRYRAISTEPSANESSQFSWVAFYEEFATKLLQFKDDRQSLLRQIDKLIQNNETPYLEILSTANEDGSRTILDDVCPFTVMAAFNRSLTPENRKAICSALGDLLGVEAAVPDGFDGIPIMNNQKSWFFTSKEKRDPGDIDRLWDMFASVIEYAQASDERKEEGLNNKFSAKFDRVIQQKGLRWTPSFGFYWARPRHFVPLDQNTRRLIQEHLDIEFPIDAKYYEFTGNDYLALIETLKGWFNESDAYARSFVELSYKAWNDSSSGSESSAEDIDSAQELEFEAEVYDIERLVGEGCFIAPSVLTRMVESLKAKKNIILQGPPGTGKTWLSKRLAFCLMGAQRTKDIVALQFHPTLSYEDFVRGWRPGVEGKLQLVDGPLMRAVETAKRNPNKQIVVVIEEINRGNPAQIFGEMLTLIESNKRDPLYGLELSHMREKEAPVFVPANLYIIGTMNNADRSLTMMDYALRRRFSFFDLTPELNERWINWMVLKAKVKEKDAQEIGHRMRILNDMIQNDDALGKDFLIGHSYVTPKEKAIADVFEWFNEIVQTEIKPLLDEYWFDRPDRVTDALKLLQGE